MVKLFQAIKDGADSLEGSSTGLLDAQLIMCHVLNVDRTYLFMNREVEIEDSDLKLFKSLIKDRQKGKPLQYITGYQEFMGLNFKVEEGVLIPRCDTETLIEVILNKIHVKDPFKIADVGCGSGAISVTLAKMIETSIVYALDIMDTPLKITKENAELNGVSDRVTILRSDKLTSLLDSTEKLDLIVSNPPYIRTKVIDTLMTEVRDYEPMSALDGGDDGLIFYREITSEALCLLNEGGYLAYEIGHDQGEDVKQIMESAGYYDVEVIKDLPGLDRVVIGRR
ncbi:MAG: peptide chain release factor N(5)-glutamine methyltransferase [Clostridium sp.]